MQVIRNNFEEVLKKLHSSDIPKYFFTGEAKQISPRLLLFQYRKKIGSAWSCDLPRYHVIHIATGLVIADVEYSEVSTVKNTFEKLKWTLHGDKTLQLYNDSIQFEMTCLISYSIKE